MKYGLLRYSYSNNIGDEMQSIAARQYLPRVDLSVERNRLQWYRHSEPIIVPFNGWFTRPAFPACWPPPESILPVFTSWYAVTPEVLINEATAEYFKQFEPIGCRSIPTIKHFERLGIEAYHSGCLTLTLPQSTDTRTDEIYIVDADPELVKAVVPESIRERARYVTHLTPSGVQSPSGWSASDLLHRALNRLDRDRRLFSNTREQWLHRRHEARMRMAEARLTLYKRAKLVITSLLHCSMPCLALGTPVVLLKKDLNTNPRFYGLKELVKYRSDGCNKLSLNWDAPEPNGDAHYKFASELRATMTARIRQFSHQDLDAPLLPST